MSNQEELNPNSSEMFNEEVEKIFNLILHNDEVNSFDYVIDSLVEVCNHDSCQAEQCALITHHNGKCDVKKGEYEMLSFMKGKLDSKGLSVTID